MKVNAEQKKSFSPIVLTITIETEEEAELMYALFNLTRNADFIGNDKAVEIRNAIGAKYGKSFGMIGSKYDYVKWYRLCNECRKL